MVLAATLLVALCSAAQSQQSSTRSDLPNKEPVKGITKGGDAEAVAKPSLTPNSVDCGRCSESARTKNWWHELRTDPVATFTGLLFFATLALWWATRNLVSGAEKTAERQLRAYIAFDFGAVLLNSPRPGTVTAWLRFKNFGVTPAYKLKGWNLFHRRAANEIPFDQNGEFENEAIIGPGGTSNLYSTLAISAEELQTVIDRTTNFFVWGRVEYIDIFDKTRHFIFKCVMTGPVETIVVDGVRAEGWGVRPIPSGFEAN
jgi:hypothetical protein